MHHYTFQLSREFLKIFELSELKIQTFSLSCLRSSKLLSELSIFGCYQAKQRWGQLSFFLSCPKHTDSETKCKNLEFYQLMAIEKKKFFRRLDLREYSEVLSAIKKALYFKQSRVGQFSDVAQELSRPYYYLYKLSIIIQFQFKRTQNIISSISMASLYLWGKPLAKEYATQSQKKIIVLHLPSPIKMFSSGEQHSVILANDGVYGVGGNVEGQLGYQLPLICGLGLVKLEIGNQVKIQSVSCGWHHTLLLDLSGNVYSSGKGDNGELGRGRVRCGSTFSIVISKARQISAGKDHSLALCGSKVYGWGNSNQGQLGLLITKSYFTPQQLNVYPCQLIFAGIKYSIFVTCKGLYATGINNHCQLGLGHQNDVQVPRRIALQEQIVQLTGSSYCCAGTSGSQWFMWGNGALGLFRYPTKMSFLKGAKYVELGLNFGIYQKQDKLYAWGDNRWGELCLTQDFKQYPTQIEQLSGLALQRISCGGSFMLGYLNIKENQEFSEASKNMSQKDVQKEEEIIISQNIGLFKQFRSNSNLSSQNHSSNSYENYYKSNNNDGVLQVNRKLYSDQSSLDKSQKVEIDKKLISYSQKISQKMNETINKSNRTFFHDKTNFKEKTKMSQLIQQQSKGLKQRLQFERFQRLRLKEQFTKNINKFQQVKMKSKIQQFETQLNKSRPYKAQREFAATQQKFQMKLLSPKQSAQISFRAKQSDKERLDSLGNKIGELSKFLHDAYK